jgi:hypothetical protein
MADSRRKPSTVRSVSVAELVAEAEAEGRDDTVGCLRYTLMAAILLLLAGMAATAFVFLASQWGWWSSSAPRPGAQVRQDGVTVALKKADPGRLAREMLERAGGNETPVAGFAIDLGGAQSFSDLSARFARIAAENAELGLEKLHPRSVLRDTVDGLEARLLVGPFDSEAAAAAACATLALPADAECAPSAFGGVAIARE